MPEPSKFPKIPTFKRDLIALWKSAGPGWMLAALVVCTLPFTLLAVGYCMTAAATLLVALK